MQEEDDLGRPLTHSVNVFIATKKTKGDGVVVVLTKQGDKETSLIIDEGEVARQTG